MLSKLTEELLDLTATESGTGNALYAVVVPTCCCCCCCLSGRSE
jgi:hypothetical protein